MIEMRSIGNIANLAASLTAAVSNGNNLVGNKGIERVMGNILWI